MKYSDTVLDASAVIAIAKREEGWKKMLPYLENACISSVNYLEVLAKLVAAKELSLEKAVSYVRSTAMEIVHFSDEQAVIAASLQKQAVSLGLSIGDRACIALGIERNARIITTDRIWSKLKLDIPIIVAR